MAWRYADWILFIVLAYLDDIKLKLVPPLNPVESDVSPKNWPGIPSEENNFFFQYSRSPNELSDTPASPPIWDVYIVPFPSCVGT